MLTPPITDLDKGEVDELFKNAIEVVCQYDRVSPSLLQRRLGVGYARAARLVEQLEKAGAVGPQDGAKPRDVLIQNPEELLEKVKEKPPKDEREADVVKLKCWKTQGAPPETHHPTKGYRRKRREYTSRPSPRGKTAPNPCQRMRTPTKPMTYRSPRFHAGPSAWYPPRR